MTANVPPLPFTPPNSSLGVGAQKVRVEEELEAYPTESVDLRCQFIDGGGRTKLTQVAMNTAFTGMSEWSDLA